MPRLLLVRHAEPEIDIAVPASVWPLTSRGVSSAEKLASVTADFGPIRIITSPEVKAVETGRIMADALGIPATADERFAEHGAGPDEFIPDYREFRASVRRFFTEPDEVVFRGESCRAAGERFSDGVAAVTGDNDDVVAVVTHGRIMATWLARLSGGTAWDIWTGLRMPDLVDVDLDAQAYRTVQFTLF